MSVKCRIEEKRFNTKRTKFTKTRKEECKIRRSGEYRGDVGIRMTADKLKSTLRKIIEGSEYLESIKSLKNSEGKSRIFGSSVRALDKGEIVRLEENGNRCENWNDIMVTEGFTTDFIHDNIFTGKCILGEYRGVVMDTGDSVSMKSGIYRCCIAHSEIGDNCLLYDNGIISHYLILHSAVVFRTNTLSATGECSFGNGYGLRVGPETGGREVLSFAELTLPVAETIALNRDNRELLEIYTEFITEYTEAARADFGIVDSGALIRGANRIYNTYIGSHARINGAAGIDNTSILSSEDEPTEVTGGSLVNNSSLQWNSAVSSMALVENSVLCEHSHAERHAKLSHTILGPNSGIAEGEATSCLIGPFVGFHHQSMLIAALWPEGRGNVGNGANIGSNHTSRAPDQEFFCGEGVFFGLGVNIKYPSDFRNSPYSIIATGVDTLPQKLDFPFSLVNKPGRVYDAIPAAHNEIFPGWAFSHNLYAVMRNENKFRERNRAARSDIPLKIFRQEIIEKVIDARKRLSRAETGENIYTEMEIPGLGKNFATAHSCVKGIQAYNMIIDYYLLIQLAEIPDELSAKGRLKKFEDLISMKTGNSEWEYAKSIIAGSEDFSGNLPERLRKLPDVLDHLVEGVLSSKKRDDARGMKIIHDYGTVNRPAEEDSFIISFTERMGKMKENVSGLIKKLS